jgi:hypothetical protein
VARARGRSGDSAQPSLISEPLVFVGENERLVEASGTLVDTVNPLHLLPQSPFRTSLAERINFIPSVTNTAASESLQSCCRTLGPRSPHQPPPSRFFPSYSSPIVTFHSAFHSAVRPETARKHRPPTRRERQETKRQPEIFENDKSRPRPIPLVTRFTSPQSSRKCAHLNQDIFSLPIHSSKIEIGHLFGLSRRNLVHF